MSLPPLLDAIEVVTFDCYGTLIDWEAGAKSTLRRLLATKNIRADEDAFFEAWEASQRVRIERYAPYRQIAAESFDQVAREQQLPLGPEDARSFADSIASWQPFPDTVQALRALKRHVRLGIISNIDDDILASTLHSLGVEFDLLMTAQQAQAYKPAPEPFRRALERLGLPADKVAHAAFGFEYDITTASDLGFRTILVRRRRTQFPPSPLPDLEVADLAELAAQFD